MATVDKQRAITENNLQFAFSHFDIDTSGVITHDNLLQCFRRQGRQVSEEEINALMDQVPVAEPGKITFEEYKSFMTELL